MKSSYWRRNWRTLLFCGIVYLHVVTSFNVDDEYNSDYLRRFYFATAQDEMESSTTVTTSTDQTKQRSFKNTKKLSLDQLNEVKDALREIFQGRNYLDSGIAEDEPTTIMNSGIESKLALVLNSVPTRSDARKERTEKKFQETTGEEDVLWFQNVRGAEESRKSNDLKIKDYKSVLPTVKIEGPTNVKILADTVKNTILQDSPIRHWITEYKRHRMPIKLANLSPTARRFGHYSRKKTKLRKTKYKPTKTAFQKLDGKIIIRQDGRPPARPPGGRPPPSGGMDMEPAAGPPGSNFSPRDPAEYTDHGEGEEGNEDGGNYGDEGPPPLPQWARTTEPATSEPESSTPKDDSPGGSEPGASEPGGGEPGGSTLKDGKPGGGKPGGNKPGTDKPGSGEPGDAKPGGAKPGSDKPESTKRTGTKSKTTSTKTTTTTIKSSPTLPNTMHEDYGTTNNATFDFETPSTTTLTLTTKPPPRFDLAALLDIIANLTYDYETNLTHFVNESLHRWSIPTCPTPTTVTTTTPTTTTVGYDYWENGTGTIMGKCFVCGLEEEGIPYHGYCGDAFDSDFLPLTPVNPVARGQIGNFRKYCRYMDIVGSYSNKSDPKSLWGRWTGGCGVRWIDLSAIYTQRTCRNRLRATLGKHFLSKRMAKLELALQHVEDGCVISPVASLVPMSRGINLYGRFHACVCSTSWCNLACKPSRSIDVVLTCAVLYLILLM